MLFHGPQTPWECTVIFTTFAVQSKTHKLISLPILYMRTPRHCTVIQSVTQSGDFARLHVLYAVVCVFERSSSRVGMVHFPFNTTGCVWPVQLRLSATDGVEWRCYSLSLSYAHSGSELQQRYETIMRSSPVSYATKYPHLARRLQLFWDR